MNSKNCVADDRVRDRGVLDQLLVRKLRAEVAAFEHALGSHDRQRNVMPHPCSRFGGKQIAGRPVEELQHWGVLPQRRVRHVDDHGRAREGVGESLAGDGVDARVEVRRDRLVAVLTELGHES
jgi:hypothetical protein